MQEEGLEHIDQGFLLRGFLFFFVFRLGIFNGGSKSDVGPNNSTCSSNARSQKVAVDFVSGLLKLGVVFHSKFVHKLGNGLVDKLSSTKYI